MCRTLHKTAVITVALLSAAAFATAQSPPPTQSASTPPSPVAAPPTTGAIDDRALSFALCPVVYQADTTPGAHGYRYLFYGNAFFINRDGYLLTAAHVLSQLRGAQPTLLLRVPNSAPRFVPATVVALDRDHDVAILRATPNPFDAGSPYRVSTLPLAQRGPAFGRVVVLAALRPFRPRNSYTLDPALEERSAGSVLSFEFSQLEKSRPADTELFLFSHSVEAGQSGAPVISPDTQQVVGFVEGQWLRTSPASLVAAKDHAIPGAVIPIHYALALLQQTGIAWQHNADSGGPDIKSAATNNIPSPLPSPLSLVPAPYPSQSLFGGEVILHALVTSSGLLADVRLIHGDSLLADKALATVRTWTFTPRATSPAAGDDTPESRISMIFEFAQPYVPPRRPTTHEHNEEGSIDTLTLAARDRVALPLITVEPHYPAGASTPGSVILYGVVAPDGQLASTQVIQDFEPFTQAALIAAREWRFTPSSDSAGSSTAAARPVVLVFIFRQPLTAPSDRR